MNQEMLDSPEGVWRKLPLPDGGKAKVHAWREEIRAILEGRDKRLLLIVGPCSVHHLGAARQYANRLKQLAREVQDRLYVIIRAYFEKPRTISGWKGLLHDPEKNGSCNIATGIQLSRSLLLEYIDMGLPAATEFVDPLASRYLQDLISWGSIGARTVQSPIHRQLASSLPMPVGFKNRTDGNVEVAIQAAIAAKSPHTFLTSNHLGQLSIERSCGNACPHIVLRGGERMENYDHTSIMEAAQRMRSQGLSPSIIVDASHDNSKKILDKQSQIFSELIEEAVRGNPFLRGIMLESFLLAGSQEQLCSSPSTFLHSQNELDFGKSFTDPCLSWETTEKLICEAHQQLSLPLPLVSL
jgi:3-deoxy-7-phosphoheptulonate synthase